MSDVTDSTGPGPEGTVTVTPRCAQTPSAQISGPTVTIAFPLSQALFN